MKIKSDIIWAVLLIGTAAVSIYIGTRLGALESEESLTNKIEARDKKIQVLEGKIQQLSEELTSRGIYSYPQANIVSEKNDQDPGSKVLITLNGKEEIKNLEIERRIIKDYSNDPEKKLEALTGNGTSNHIGNLTAHNPVSFELEKFQNEVAMDLIFKSGRNQWHQYIRIKKTADGKLKSFWILTNQNSEVIDKHIDEGFPTEENGFSPFGEDSNFKYSDIRTNSTFIPYSK